VADGDVSEIAEAQYGATTARLDARIALHAEFSVAVVDWLRWVFDQIRFDDVGVLLEVGAGTGFLWSRNQEHLPPDLRLVLTDLSPVMCERLAALSVARCGVARSDVMRLPFRTDSVDAVVADHMLYHAADPDTAVSEIARVMKPSARAYAATNGREHMRELEDLATQIGLPYGPGRLHLPFALENAVDQLHRHFARVELVPFVDRLEVTRSEPLADYLESVIPVSPEQRRELMDIVDPEIRRKGHFAITKSVGLFICEAAQP
jgi:ubiquinone/menaquinone biosynthesis C-methylase UbiE